MSSNNLLSLLSESGTIGDPEAKWKWTERSCSINTLRSWGGQCAVSCKWMPTGTSLPVAKDQSIASFLCNLIHNHSFLLSNGIKISQYFLLLLSFDCHLLFCLLSQRPLLLVLHSFPMMRSSAVILFSILLSYVIVDGRTHYHGGDSRGGGDLDNYRNYGKEEINDITLWINKDQGGWIAYWLP